MLDHSTSELERTIDQLQEKHNSVDDEGNFFPFGFLSYVLCSNITQFTVITSAADMQ